MIRSSDLLLSVLFRGFLLCISGAGILAARRYKSHQYNENHKLFH